MSSLKCLTVSVCMMATLPAGASDIDNYMPSCAPVGITKACDPSSQFAAFPGRYNFYLKVGEQVFVNQLEINYITRHPGMLSMAEVVAGFLSVPSVPFMGPLQNGKIGMVSVPVSQGFEISFEVRMKEKDRTFPIYYYLKGPKVNDACVNHGAAYLDAARTQLLGTLTMVKTTPDCRCG